jgi:murein DD-endopeptidase MepM/ murein hydrolase activator NlpD
VISRVKARGKEFLDELDGWPVPTDKVILLKDDTTVVRKDGLHQGVDIRVPAGTAVLAPEPLTVITLGNGIGSKDEHKAKAGLWVDARGKGGRILRFLHLATGSVRVQVGQRLNTGDVIGEVANTGDSGVKNSAPHLHFEVRRPGWKKGPDASPINPVALLPYTGNPGVLRQLASVRSRTRDEAT